MGLAPIVVADRGIVNDRVIVRGDTERQCRECMAIVAGVRILLWKLIHERAKHGLDKTTEPLCWIALAAMRRDVSTLDPQEVS